MTGPLGILGPGVLGCSAAQAAAERGLEVHLLGRDVAHAAAGVAELNRRWDRAVTAGRMPPAAAAEAAARLRPAAFAPEALAGLVALLEALPEDPAPKAQVLATAAGWGDPDLLLLSGTSSLPISDLARRAELEGRLVGFHLFVPVPRMAVVELAVPVGTGPTWVTRALALGAALGKRVVQVRDQPGFAAARMALAQGLEAMRLLEAGVASAEDLDALMTLGYGHPVGPLELSDRVGLDLRLRIAEGLVGSGESRFQVPDVLRAQVARGEAGTRSGQGFFTWDAQGRRS